MVIRRPDMAHVCIRIYPNGSANYSVRDEAGAKNWLAYNSEWRPGNTLVIDGVVIEGTGGLRGDELQSILDFVMSRELPDPEIRTIGKHWCDIERSYHDRYPDDDELVSDRDGMRFIENLRSKAASSPRL